jgi:hypothetical protein
MRRIAIPKFLFIAEGVLWVVLGIGFAVYSRQTLELPIIAIVSASILAYSVWLMLIGSLLREGNRRMYFLAVLTAIATMAVSVMDDLGIADFLVAAYNFVLFLSLILLRKDYCARGSVQNPPPV